MNMKAAVLPNISKPQQVKRITIMMVISICEVILDKCGICIVMHRTRPLHYIITHIVFPVMSHLYFCRQRPSVIVVRMSHLTDPASQITANEVFER